VILSRIISRWAAQGESAVLVAQGIKVARVV
jgi:hypothetical protein